jgi:Serine/threonine protein kinase
MIEAGKILQQRYKIDKQIGQGGMGAVYVATDERFGSTVAIKQTLCMDDNYRKAIEREARLLNSLKHTALPRVSDHFLEDDGQFLVMEFIPGEDLCCILEESGKPFEPGQILIWADQLLDALDFLHNQKDPVIHRDIKPQNLKITPKGQIILLDFGLAKGNPTESNNKTAAKSIFGYSRSYASLEQIQGTGTDPRSDLYSLAATLYHLATANPPEDALTRAMAVLSQKPDPLVPAHLINPLIPKGFSVILQNAMDLNADLRPASAVEMRKMLNEHEKYALLAATAMPTDHVTDAAVFSQKTKLMPEATKNLDQATEVKTELMSGGGSQVTAMRIPSGDGNTEGESVPAGSSKRFAFVAGGLGSLLIVGAVVGGVVLYAPSDLERSISSPEAAPAQASVAETSVSTESTSASVVNVPANVPVATDERRTAASTTETRKESSIAEQRAAAETSPERLEIETDEGKIIIDGDNVFMGDTKIVGNKVVTPNGVYELKEPPIPPRVLQMEKEFPANMKQLTPEQRRQLIRTFRRFNYNGNTMARPPRAPQE